jgi:RNA polymerase sigma factor (sigma-70 family)
MDPSDEELIAATPGDVEAFATFYRRHAQRRGVADDRARRRLGIPHLTLTDEAIERVEDLAELEPSRVASALEGLPHEQREAVRARVLAGRSYADIAREGLTSEANVRQRVARGLARLRTHLGGAP